MPAPKPVSQWTLEDARAELPRGLPRDYEINRLLIEEHDHWQHGKLWPGHRTGDPATDAILRANIEPQFLADDVAGELVDNRTNGLLGQEADVALVPLQPAPEASTAADAQQAEIDAILADLSAWWDRKQFWRVVAQAVDRVHYAGRATVRAYIPAGNLRLASSADAQPQLPTAATRAAALGLIEVEAPASHQAKRYTDPTSQRPVGLLVTKDAEDQDKAEVYHVDPATGKTVLRVLGPQPARDWPLDLRGRLPIAEVVGKRVITPSVRHLQSLLNFITTVTSRTVETAGFRERYTKNVEPPGIWSTQPPVNGPPLAVDAGSPGGPFYKHAIPWTVGASITTDLVGLRQRIILPSGEQREEYADPGVEALDPVDPAYATDAAETVTLRLYRRGKQGHLGLAKTGEASGTAYQQARAQFAADLDGLRGPTEGMIRDVLEAALAYAGLLATEAAGILDRYRVQVTLHPMAGPVTPEDARLAVELRDQRAISQQAMLARVGVEDPVAEQEAIDADPMVRAEFWSKMAVALSTLTGIQGTEMTAEGAGFLLGLTPEQIEVLRTGRPPAEAGERKLEAVA